MRIEIDYGPKLVEFWSYRPGSPIDQRRLPFRGMRRTSCRGRSFHVNCAKKYYCLAKGQYGNTRLPNSCCDHHFIDWTEPQK